MQIIQLLINEKVADAEFSLKQANSENIVERCKNYLHILNQYHDELCKIGDQPAINNMSHYSPFLTELATQTRNSVQTAALLTNRERCQTEALLKSFTSISGYEAVRTFNLLEYKGFSDWELRANQVRLINDNNNESFTVEESIEIAGHLRRTAYISYKTIFSA